MLNPARNMHNRFFEKFQTQILKIKHLFTRCDNKHTQTQDVEPRFYNKGNTHAELLLIMLLTRFDNKDNTHTHTHTLPLSFLDTARICWSMIKFSNERVFGGKLHPCV